MNFFCGVTERLAPCEVWGLRVDRDHLGEKTSVAALRCSWTKAGLVVIAAVGSGEVRFSPAQTGWNFIPAANVAARGSMSTAAAPFGPHTPVLG